MYLRDEMGIEVDSEVYHHFWKSPVKHQWFASDFLQLKPIFKKSFLSLFFNGLQKYLCVDTISDPGSKRRMCFHAVGQFRASTSRVPRCQFNLTMLATALMKVGDVADSKDQSRLYLSFSNEKFDRAITFSEAALSEQGVHWLPPYHNWLLCLKKLSTVERELGMDEKANLHEAKAREIQEFLESNPPNFENPMFSRVAKICFVKH